MANSDISNPSTPQQEKPEPVVPETKTPEHVETEPLPNPGAEQAVNPEVADPATPAENAEFASGSVICAQPISIVAPGGSSSRKKTMDPVEMAKRPAWLPDDWRMDCRQRTNGATAGLIDRYYYEPSGKHRFRSKNEVFTYLDQQNGKFGSEAGPSETPGSSKKKRKSSSKTDDGASASGTKKKRKYTRKDKKSAAPETAGEVPAETEEPKVENIDGEAHVNAGGETDGVITKEETDAMIAGMIDGQEMVAMFAGATDGMIAGGATDGVQAEGEINADDLVAGVEAESGGEC